MEINNVNKDSEMNNDAVRNEIRRLHQVIQELKEDNKSLGIMLDSYRKKYLKWIIVEGTTEDGNQKEYQVSDGKPYDGTDNKNERTMSYDFTKKQDAQELCNKLNKVD